MIRQLSAAILAVSVAFATGCSKQAKSTAAETEAAESEEAATAAVAEEKYTAPRAADGLPELRDVAVADAADKPAPIADGLADASGAFADWFEAHHLDLKDPTMLDADADGDGFSNRDEFYAETDPRDAKSRPDVHSKIVLKEAVEVRLPVVLETVSKDAAQIRRLDSPDAPLEKVKPGDTLRGLPYKVARIQLHRTVDKHGEPVDMSAMLLDDPSTKEQIRLVKNLPARTAATHAVLASVDGKTTLKVREDQTFSWPGEEGVTYTVTELSQNQVVLRQNESKKVFTLRREK